jgi:hypothetical protein
MSLHGGQHLLTSIADSATWRSAAMVWSLLPYEVPFLGVVGLQNAYKGSIDVGVSWSVSWDKASPQISSPLVHPAHTRQWPIRIISDKIVKAQLRPFALYTYVLWTEKSPPSRLHQLVTRRSWFRLFIDVSGFSKGILHHTGHQRSFRICLRHSHTFSTVVGFDPLPLMVLTILTFALSTNVLPAS